MVLKQAFATYSPDRQLPLGSYAALMAAYGLHVAGFLRWASRRRLPRLEALDFVLLSLATHKLARVVARDWVTIPLRAPFAQYESSQPGGEVSEKVRGSGPRQALGDLLTCPFCVGPWVAAPLVYTWTASPRLGRLLGAIFGAVTVSDFLHRGYALANARREELKQRADRLQAPVPGPKADLRI